VFKIIWSGEYIGMDGVGFIEWRVGLTVNSSFMVFLVSLLVKLLEDELWLIDPLFYYVYFFAIDENESSFTMFYLM